MSERLPIALVGACGKMGRMVQAYLETTEDFLLAWRIDPSLPTEAGPPRAAPTLDPIKPSELAGIIDFSSAAGTTAAAAAAARIGCPLVSGTTAIDDGGRAALDDAARIVPVCWSANFSIGVPVLIAALRAAAERLPGDWHLEISETHHAAKRDAPSGTALRLGETWRDARGGRFVHGRQGIAGPRADDEIGMHALRAGDVVGEHRLLLGGRGEVIELIHRMQNRTAFAQGSIEALRRLRHLGPGRYEWGELLCSV